MTFTEITTEISDRLNYTSSTATTRIGRLVNKIYREITTSIGLNTSRFVSTTKAVAIGNPEVTFTAFEKIETVWIQATSGTPTLLKQVLLTELRGSTVPSSDHPTKYAIVRIGSNSVTIRLDKTPSTAYTIYADGTTEVADLSGGNEPAFPESFHDVIIEGVLKDEYKKMEKRQLAQDSEATYLRRLSDLRMFIAKANFLDIYQGKARNQKGQPDYWWRYD